jgi:hypothetical protein
MSKYLHKHRQIDGQIHIQIHTHIDAAIGTYIQKLYNTQQHFQTVVPWNKMYLELLARLIPNAMSSFSVVSSTWSPLVASVHSMAVKIFQKRSREKIADQNRPIIQPLTLPITCPR